MKPIPATITNKTMKTLSETRTRLTRIDSLIPTVTSTVRTSTSSSANRLGWPKAAPSAYPMLAGQVMPILSSRSCAYADQPCATTLAPSMSSSMRSQPMIHATISPSEAYENVYAEPDTGTADANSA